MAKEITNEDLARMIAKGFNEVHSKFDELKDDNKKDHDSFKRDLSDVSFKTTETVHKSDHNLLQERVQKIETKLKIA